MKISIVKTLRVKTLIHESRNSLIHTDPGKRFVRCVIVGKCPKECGNHSDRQNLRYTGWNTGDFFRARHSFPAPGMRVCYAFSPTDFVAALPCMFPHSLGHSLTVAGGAINIRLRWRIRVLPALFDAVALRQSSSVPFPEDVEQCHGKFP